MLRDLPPIMILLQDLWGIEPDLMRRFWNAIVRSRWTEITTWQRELLLLQTVGDPAAAAQGVCAPARLMHVIELLVREHQLARRGASQIESKILDLLDCAGAWK